MKNRTIIGIICMVLAVAVTFLVAPFVTRLSTDTISVPRLREDVSRGSQIQQSAIEMVSVRRDTIPGGIITDPKKIIGLYAATHLFAGDYLTSEKLSLDSNTAEDVLSSLNGDKCAMSFSIDSFATGLSGKLQNGDIISLIVIDKSTGQAVIPAEFKYLKVITVTTSDGVDQDRIVANDDGSSTQPSTVTLLVNATQAKLLAEYESSTIHCVLVYRGNEETANRFLEMQDTMFLSNEGGTLAGNDPNSNENHANEAVNQNG